MGRQLQAMHPHTKAYVKLEVQRLIYEAELNQLSAFGLPISVHEQQIPTEVPMHSRQAYQVRRAPLPVHSATYELHAMSPCGTPSPLPEYDYSLKQNF